MTLSLRDSVLVSLAGHVLFLAVFSLSVGILAPKLPRIMEITLVSGEGPAGGEQGAGLAAASGGAQGAAVVKSVSPAAKGQVSVASPEFTHIGAKPRRSGEELMGARPGEGGGAVATGVAGKGTGGGGRKLRYQEPLEYPDWAKEQAIDAKVVLMFKVLPNGSVDSSIIVKRTSGWRQLDELAIKALRNFLFESLPAGTPQVPQWGELSFHFKPE